ncbi:ATP-binding protein [Leadbettera azotonutricia]|uniref:Biotin carboxylase n=1 Tax=Leadbettera azotonutricia (strain ATCC BAA-888 / DSM 13862 / ZAS-9) TaxID=545695 RepID=F5YG53_LEAAZ|nr:ATP-binding protein [Leadbettera azotonutricia]AEF81938.1 biotin carboxylase [Leadbettera azotonutricia ZAS-9]
MGPNIPKRLSAAILNSLQGGVVPRVGLEYVAVGRKREIETVLRDLENISQGAAAFRFVSGSYGSGKSFFLQALRNFALEKDFLAADADLSPEKRLSGSGNQGLETYRELMERLSTKVRPEGGALESMLQKWIARVKTELIKEGLAPSDENFDSQVEIKIFETINEMQDYAHGYDFAAAVSTYYHAYVQGDEEKRNAALRWLRGEFATKTEARAFLPVGEVITDENWYEYIRLFAAFCARIGYRGFLIFIDECVNLYKISNRQSRENNYEKVLAMFNDVMQGKAANLGIYMAGTPQFIEDERRGLASYAALKSRLAESRFAREGYADSGSPVIRLDQLSREEIYVLLERLTNIHAQHYDYSVHLGERELLAFLELAFSVPGAEEFITPREITRDFLGLLNILHDDPNADFDVLIKRENIIHTSAGHDTDNLYADFEL